MRWCIVIEKSLERRRKEKLSYMIPLENKKNKSLKILTDLAASGMFSRKFLDSLYVAVKV